MQLSELESRFQISPLQRIDDLLLNRQGVELWMKRDDLLHPIISGNKWRKLKFILNHADSLSVQRIVSMGGAYSNHLHALAYTGKLLGLQTAGFIRGERPAQFSPTLMDLQRWGMELNFVSRSEYRELRLYKNHDSLPGLSDTDYWLPEGGATSLALRGVAEITAEIEIDYDVLCAPCGTGTTLAGLIAAAPGNYIKLLGVSALKGGDFLFDDVTRLLPAPEQPQWDIVLGYHFGGFAKQTVELTGFIETFESQHRITLDPVYTGKMMYALFDLIKQGAFQRGQRIIALHTGGLQGRRRMAL